MSQMTVVNGQNFWYMLDQGAKDLIASAQGASARAAIDAATEAQTIQDAAQTWNSLMLAPADESITTLSDMYRLFREQMTAARDASTGMEKVAYSYVIMRLNDVGVDFSQ